MFFKALKLQWKINNELHKRYGIMLPDIDRVAGHDYGKYFIQREIMDGFNARVEDLAIELHFIYVAEGGK